MIWSYRAVNNRVARRKWIALSLLLIFLAAFTSLVRLSYGADFKKVVLSLIIFVFVVTLYMLITLGKVRFYFIEGGTVYYKPFKTKISEISGFTVDEDNMIIKLHFKKPKLIGVKTLYFERREDLTKVRDILSELIK